MAAAGYFDIPFTTGQASPPPPVSLFPNNPMLGAVASLIGRAIGGTDSEGNPFFKLPSFQPDTRTMLERTLYGNNAVVQQYLASMNKSLGIQNLGNILQHTPLSGFAGNQTFSEFALPFVNEFLMKSQDPTFGAMQSGIYGAHNQMFPGTGIGSNTPQGDAAALAGIYKSMYKNTWGDHNVNNVAFTYGLTEQQMAPLVQRAVASGAYSSEINNVRTAGQAEYVERQAYNSALRNAFSGQEDKLKIYKEGTAAIDMASELRRGARGEDARLSSILETSRKNNSALSSRLSDYSTRTISDAASRREQAEIIASKMSDRSKLEEENEKLQKELSQAKTDADKNRINGEIGANTKQQSDLNEAIKNATEKYNQLTKDINTRTTEFKNGASGESESIQKVIKEYADNTNKLVDVQDKLAQAQKLESEGNKKISEAVGEIPEETRRELSATKSKVDAAKRETEDAISKLNDAMLPNQQNLNKTISAMTSAYGSAELATQAFDLEYGPRGYRDTNLQNRALDNAYRLHAAASEAGIDVRRLTQTRMMTMNAAGARMGLTQEELKAGWGAEDSGRFGQAAAEASVIGGYDPITGRFDPRRYEKLAPGYRERYAEAANSQQDKLQTIIQYMAQTGQISKDQLDAYRSMLEQGDNESRRAGIRDMATQLFGSYDEFMRVYNDNNYIQLMRDDLTQESRDAKAASIERQVKNQNAADVNKRVAQNVERRATADLMSAGKSFDEVENIKDEGELQTYQTELDDLGEKGKDLRSAIEARRAQLEKQYPDDPGRVTKELNSYVKKYAADLLPKEDADRLIQSGKTGRANAVEKAAQAATPQIALGRQINVVEQRNAYGELTDEEKSLYHQARDLMKNGDTEGAQKVFSKFQKSLEDRGHTGLAKAITNAGKVQPRVAENPDVETKRAAAEVATARGKNVSYAGALEDADIKNSQDSAGVVPDKEGKTHTDKTAAEQIQENIEKAKATIGTKVEEKAQSGSTGMGEVIQGVVTGKLYNPILNGGASPEELKNSPIMQAIEELKNLLADISNNTFGTYDSLRLGGGGI